MSDTPNTHHMNGSTNSHVRSTGYEPFILQELFKQTGMLHEIQEKVKPIPGMQQQIATSRVDIAELKAVSTRSLAGKMKDLAKENWTWLAAIGVILLQLLGQPQMAAKLSSASRPPDYGDSSR